MASSGRLPDGVESPVSIVQSALRSTSLAATAEQPCLIGFSGGLDSAVLLHAAATVYGPGQLLAVHIHHGLQPDADQWAKDCRHQAEALGVGFELRYADQSPKKFPGGVENWARNQRRVALREVAVRNNASVLMLAHHADDQAETVLMNLARGAGPDGLAAMRIRRSRDGLTVLRPLLAISRRVLRAYATAFDLDFVIDPSNADTSLTRNRVRHSVLPVLNEALPGFDQALVLSAENSADMVRAMELSLFGDGGPPAELDRIELASRHGLVAAQMLRLWLRSRQLRSPGRARLAHMLNELVDSSAAYAEVHHDGHRICRYRNRILARSEGDERGKPDSDDPAVQSGRADAEVVGRFPLRWQGEPVIHLPAFNGELRFDPVAPGSFGLPATMLKSADLQVGPLLMSARIRMHPEGPSRRLKQLCQERGIPRWERAALPMIWHGDAPLFAAQIGANARWLIQSGGQHVALVLSWEPN
ncbi:MAG: tRNA lysidine(34) synthetase TilS [Burkholderiaceae bacterium]